MLVAFSIANSGRFAIHLEMYFGVVLLRGYYAICGELLLPVIDGLRLAIPRYIICKKLCIKPIISSTGQPFIRKPSAPADMTSD